MTPDPRPAGRRGALTLAGSVGGDPHVLVVPTPRDVGDRAARLIGETVGAALESRGAAHIALTGGSTAGIVYRSLTRLDLDVDWAAVQLWWGDDRFVPRTDALSNAHLADVDLLGPDGGTGLDIPDRNVHPFPVDAAIAAGNGPAECAAAYADELARALPVDADGWPVFDLVLLGVGPDGHLLSVFPGSAAFDDPGWALGIPAPTHVAPHVPRVTLNPAIVPAARAVLAMVTGEGKAAIARAVFADERNPRVRPSQLALREGATWIFDASAAEDLPPGVTSERDEQPRTGA